MMRGVAAALRKARPLQWFFGGPYTAVQQELCRGVINGLFMCYYM